MDAPHNIARLTADWPATNTNSELPRAGQLVRVEGEVVWTGMDRTGWRRDLDALQLDRHPKLDHRDFQQLLKLYLNAGGVLPNLKPADQKLALQSIAAASSLVVWPRIAHVKLPGDGFSRWARAFVTQTQGGQLDGRGILVTYQRHQSKEPVLWNFALCDHEIQAGAGARPNYGWHPSRCTLCGLNTSVDSGD